MSDGKKYKSKSVKVKISFTNYFQQLPAPFKIYADFECILKGVKSSDKNNGSYTEKYQDHVPCSFANKAVFMIINSVKKVVLYRGKNDAYEFIKPILNE